MMNQLMLEIKKYHIVDEIVKLIKKDFINLKKIIKRLQLIIFKRKQKINCDIRARLMLIFLHRLKRIFVLLI